MDSLGVLAKVILENSEVKISQIVIIVRIDGLRKVIFGLLGVLFVLFVAAIRTDERIMPEADGVENFGIGSGDLFQILNRLPILPHFLVAQSNVVQAKPEAHVSF